MSQQSNELGSDVLTIRTAEEAEIKVSQLMEEIDAIGRQMADREWRSGMTRDEDDAWYVRAKAARDRKNALIRRLRIWVKYEGRKERIGFRNSADIAQTLKLAAKQYGRLVAVLEAADEYLGSMTAEERERTYRVLEQCVHNARKIVAKLTVPNEEES